MAFFIQSHRWIDGIVPYTITGSGITDSDRKMIQDAIDVWQTQTVIRFKLRTKESDYVRIRVNGGGGGTSAVGRRGGAQTVNIDPSYNPPFALIHELAHAVGMFHEHIRPDRNQFVKVTSSKSSYKIEKNGIMVGPYDCHSTMAYSSDPGFTYIPGACDPSGHGLSDGDRNGIAYVYAGALGSNVATYHWTSGWTNAFFYEVDGNPFMFFLKSKTGDVEIHRVEADGTVGSLVEHYDWTGGWTNAFFYEVDAKPFMFFLKSLAGLPPLSATPTAAARTQVLDDGTVGADLDRYDWTRGWTSAFVYRVAGKPFIFLLKAKEGTARIRRIGASV